MNFRSFGAALECGACSHETADLCEKTFLMIPMASLYGQTFILSQDFLEKRKQNLNETYGTDGVTFCSYQIKSLSILLCVPERQIAGFTNNSSAFFLFWSGHFNM